MGKPIASRAFLRHDSRMTVSIEMPDQVAATLHLEGERGKRRILEMVALEGYRAGELSRGQVSELLGQSFYETEGFLKEHGCGSCMTVEEFERTALRLDEILKK